MLIILNNRSLFRADISELGSNRDLRAVDYLAMVKIKDSDIGASLSHELKTIDNAIAAATSRSGEDSEQFYRLFHILQFMTPD